MKIIKQIIAGLVLLSIAVGLTYCFFFTAQHLNGEVDGWEVPIFVFGMFEMGLTFIVAICLLVFSIMGIVYWSIKQLKFKPKIYDYSGFKGAQ